MFKTTLVHLSLILLFTQGCVWPKQRYHTVDKSMTTREFYQRMGIEAGHLEDVVALDSVLQAGQRVYVPYERGKKIDESRRSRRTRAIRAHSFIWPIQGGLLTSAFGYRWNRFHEGIDLVAPIGTPIHAAQNGVVLYAGNSIKGYGNMVVLKHPNGLVTVYAHNKETFVRKGQKVQKGDKIASLGGSGKTTGAHLHFEVRNNSRPIDPMIHLAKKKRKKSWTSYILR